MLTIFALLAGLFHHPHAKQLTAEQADAVAYVESVQKCLKQYTADTWNAAHEREEIRAVQEDIITFNVSSPGYPEQIEQLKSDYSLLYYLDVRLSKEDFV